MIPDMMVGDQIAKEFPDVDADDDDSDVGTQLFLGRIININVGEDGEPTFYHVRYDDGDEEDLEYEECMSTFFMYKRLDDRDVGDDWTPDDD